MEYPQHFINWLPGSGLMQGKKVKGTVALAEFKFSTKNRFKSLKKTVFYIWLTKYCDENNIDLKVETKKDGKWFYIPSIYRTVDEFDLTDPKHINNKHLEELTSKNFCDWMFTQNFQEYKTIHTSEAYNNYMEFSGSRYMTKQMFNNYLRFACIRLTGYMPYEGRSAKGKIMRFISKNNKSPYKQ